MPGEQHEPERTAGEHEHERPGGARALDPALGFGRADTRERHGGEAGGDHEREQSKAHQGAATIAIHRRDNGTGDGRLLVL